MGRLRRLLTDLAGRSDVVFVDALTAQLLAVDRAIGAVEDSLRDGDIGALRERVGEHEADGDEQRRQLVRELRRSLTTPIDREDLFRLSRSIDDVVDNVRDFAREVTLYRLVDLNGFLPLLVAAREGIAHLGDAVACLAADPHGARKAAQATKAAGNRMRTGYEDRLAELFAGDLDMEVIKTRELLRRLDVVALRLREAADALDDGLVKRT